MATIPAVNYDQVPGFLASVLTSTGEIKYVRQAPNRDQITLIPPPLQNGYEYDEGYIPEQVTIAQNKHHAQVQNMNMTAQLLANGNVSICVNADVSAVEPPFGCETSVAGHSFRRRRPPFLPVDAVGSSS